MEGDLSVCPLGDLLHIVSAREKAARIEFLRDDEAIGSLVVHGPLVLEAVAAGLSGDAAFFHLWHQRMFRFRVLPHSAPAAPASRASPWRELVFEAALQEDEASNELTQVLLLPPPGDYPEHEFTAAETHPVSLLPSGPRVEAPTATVASLPSTASSPSPAAETGALPLDERIAMGTKAYLAGDREVALKILQACQAVAPNDPRILLLIRRITLEVPALLSSMSLPAPATSKIRSVPAPPSPSPAVAVVSPEKADVPVAPAASVSAASPVGVSSAAVPPAKAEVPMASVAATSPVGVSSAAVRAEVPLASEAEVAARALLVALKGVKRVELVDGDVRVALAGEAQRPRISPAFASAALPDGADFLALRSGTGLLIGAKMASSARRLWAEFPSEVSIGAAVAALFSAGVLPRLTRAKRGADQMRWRGGSAEVEARLGNPFSFGRDVLAVVVLRGDEMLFASGHTLSEAECVALARRYRAVFDVPPRDREPTPRPGDGPRTLVAGEERVLCFGGETPEAGEGTTVWVLTRRDGAKGIGWACLAALSRAMGSSPTAEALR